MRRAASVENLESRVLMAAAGAAVHSFSLIDATTDRPVVGYESLTDLSTLNLATLPTRKLNVRADLVVGGGLPGSVVFGLDARGKYSTDSAGEPFALGGDRRGDYAAWTPARGFHTLTATSFEKVGGKGSAAAPLTVRFSVIDDRSVPLPRVSVGAERPLAYEGGAADAPLRFRFARAGRTDAPLVVPFTVSGDATVGTDFPHVGGSVTIPAGATSTLLSVLPVADGLAERPERVEVALAGDAGFHVDPNHPSAEGHVADGPGDLVSVDFDHDAAGRPLPAGTVVSDQYAAMGLTVSSGETSRHPPMIFDTARPSSVDLDLGTPARGFGGPGRPGAGGAPDAGGPGSPHANFMSHGNALILSEDANPAVPNDYGAGGRFVFEFATPADVRSIDLLEVEKPGATATAYDEAGAPIGSRTLPPTDRNGFASHALGLAGVSRLVVLLKDSGAVTRLTFTPGRDTSTPNRPPAFTTAPPSEPAAAGAAYAYDANAADPDGDPLAFTLVSGPDGLTVDPASGVVAWTPGAVAIGDHPVVIRVDDGRGGSSDQAFTVGVFQPNRPPAFTTLPPVEGVVAGTAYSYDADASDADGDPLAYSLVSGPAGMVVDPATGVVTWMPGETQVGSHPLVLRVADGRGGSADQAYAVEVSPPPPPALDVTLALDPLYDTDVEGDGIMSLPAADLLGVTAPGARVTLYRAASPDAPLATVEADDAGAYEFALVEHAFGPNEFVATATRGGQTTTADLTVVRVEAVGQNRPPEITSTPVTGAAAQTGNGGRLVVSATPDALADAAFEAEPEAAGRLAGNLVAYLTGKQAPKVLVYSDHPGVAGAGLAASMRAAGVDWTASTAVPFTAVELTGYDAVFVGGTPVPAQVLADYLSAGGNAFLVLGTGGFGGPDGEAAAWNPLLQPLGLGAAPTTFVASAGSAPVAPGSHPVLAGVDRVVQGSGLGLADADPLDDLGATVLADAAGRTVLAVYDPAFAPARGGYRYDVNATDPDGDTVRYGFGLSTDGSPAAPAGMWIDPATGVVRWSPRSDQTGSYDVTVVAADDRGGADDQAFTVVVAAANPNRPPTFVSQPVTQVARTASGAEPYAYDAEAADPDSDALAYSLVTGPAGMQVDPQTGNVSWAGPADPAGPYPVTIRVDDGRGGSAEQSWSIVDGSVPVPQLPTDLTIADVHAHDLIWDAQALTVSGDVEAVIQNLGPNAVVTPFDVSFFEDRNYDGDYDDGLDALLGVTTVSDPLAVGESRTVGAIVAGNVLFRGNLVWGFVDSGNALAETDEANNYAESGADCVLPPGVFDPAVEWSKTTFTTLPASNQVEMVPLVLDLDGNGTTEIVVTTYTPNASRLNGSLRALDGASGSELWTVTNPALELWGTAGLAAGDIDGDGRPEIVGVSESGVLIAFEHDGTLKWKSSVVAVSDISDSQPSIADLNADGTPEIVLGSEVYNADGTRRWRGSLGRGFGGYGDISAVADLDGDGVSEVVAGRTAYRADGSVYWNAAIPDGAPAIGNFDADPSPEIVVVGSGNVYLLNHDGTRIWGPKPIPGGGKGGAPTIADVDGDGQPEIGVAGATRYVVFEPDGTIKWQAVTRDGSSNATGSSVFDFEGDGAAEIVYGDETTLRVYRGTDGAVLYQLPKSSGTVHEYPVIADVDNDGNAEIVAVANQTNGFGTQRGVYVIGSKSDSWVNTRAVWNQHTYHVTNVNDDGTIPRNEQPSWLAHNTYRLNRLSGSAALASPNLTASYIRTTPAGAGTILTARVGNGGAIFAPAKVKVAFYKGDPKAGGTLLGVGQTNDRLEPGYYEDVSVTVTADPGSDVWVVVDDDGTGKDAARECDEADNVHHFLRPGAGEIRGTKFADSNGDGVRSGATVGLVADAASSLVDPGLAGWTIYLDGNNNAKLDTGERWTATDANGDYAFTDLPPGKYVVREVQQPAWVQTFPSLATDPAATGDGYADRVLDFFYAGGGPIPGPYGRLAGGGLSAVDPSIVLGAPPPAPHVGWNPLTDWLALPTDSHVTVQFLDEEVFDGPGDDLFIRSLDPADSAGEVADVYVSSDLAHFTFAGRVGQQGRVGLDLASSGFSGFVRAVRVVGVDMRGWSPGFDLVSIEAQPRSQRGTMLSGAHVVDVTAGAVAQPFVFGNAPADPSNRAPAFATTPPTRAAAGTPYAYDADATDADGDPVAYELVAGPSGMSVVAATGLLSWTPTQDQTGTFSVRVRATDGRGGITDQAYTVGVGTAAAANAAPKITTTPATTAVRGTAYRYDADATDPDGDPVTFALLAGPQGATLSPATGVLSLDTAALPAGTYDFSVRAADPFEADFVQAFQLTVAADATAPIVGLTVIRGSQTLLGQELVVDLDDELTIQVSATDDGGVVGRTLKVGDQTLLLDGLGRATYDAAAGGLFALTATATDAAGNVGTATRTLRVLNPQNANAPTVVITSPLHGATVVALKEIRGSAVDLDGDFDYYKVEYAPVADADAQNLARGTYKLLHRGEDEVRDGVLATLDTTLLRNDDYVIRVTAFDTNGRGWVEGVLVSVTGELKLGNFRLQFTDLQVPLAGIPITVNRIYDTLHAGRDGDFGYGWSLGIGDADLRETVPDTGSSAFTATPLKVGSRVFVTTPDGRRVGFTFDPLPYKAGLLAVTYRPYFKPDPGVYEKLDVTGQDGVFSINAKGEARVSLFGFAWNPDVYQLTTPDNLKYTIDQRAGVKKIVDLSGNTVAFSDTAITHSSGESIQIVRDGKGRIDKIVDPAGNELDYAYNAAGDLTGFEDQLDNATKFTYRTDRPHYLDEITDPLNRRAVKTEYGPDGRIKAIIDALGNRVEQDFDPTNFTGTTTDARGNVTDLVYDARGNLLKEIEPAPAAGGTRPTTLYKYQDAANPDLATSVTNPNGHETRSTFDPRGNQLTRTDALGNATTFAYEPGNRLTAVTDALGRTTRFTYDGRGLLVKTTDATGANSSTGYDGSGRPAAVTDRNGNTTRFEYATAGSQPTKVVNPDLSVRTLAYNPFGEVTKIVDERGFTAEFGYDAAGHLLLVRDGVGAETRLAYSAEQLVSETDPLGRVTRYQYDAADRLTKLTDAVGGTTLYGYDADGRVVSTTDPLGHTRLNRYDAGGRLIEVTDAAGFKTSYGYDPAGNRTSVTDPRANKTTYSFDAADRLVTIAQPLGGTETRGYDALGNVISVTDALGNTTARTYDALYRLTGETDALGHLTAYAYDPVGNLLSLTDAAGQKTSFTYNSRSWQTRREDPRGKVTTFGYDAGGNQSEVTDRDGRRRTFSYDGMNRLVKEQWWDGGSTVWTATSVYDLVGNRTGVQDPASAYAFDYDALDRLARTDNAGTPGAPATVLTYGYDGVGNVLSVRDQAGVEVTSRYDARDLLSSRSWNVAGSPASATFSYDGRGLRETTERFVGTSGSQAAGTSTASYDADGRITGLVHGSAAGAAHASYTYGYDPIGRLTSEAHHGGSAAYTYDPTAQLVGADRSQAADEAYAYDAVGNRQGPGIATSAGNRLAGDAEFTYQYDDEGNLVGKTAHSSGEVTTYAYDHRNRLTRVQRQPAGGTPLSEVAYTYDALDRRIAVSVDGQTTLTTYDGDHAWADHAPGGAVTVRYLFDDRTDGLLARHRASDGLAWYLTDRLGTVRDIVNGGGTAVIDHVDYDSWGNVVAETNAAAGDRFKFTGREFDAAAGVYYYRARYFDPRTGRFMSEDPIGFAAGDVNLFRYGGNSPTNGTDPSGLTFVETAAIDARLVNVGFAGLLTTQVYVIQVQNQDFLIRATSTAISNIGQGAEAAFGILGAAISSATDFALEIGHTLYVEKGEPQLSPNFKPPTNLPQLPKIPEGYVSEPNPQRPGSVIWRPPGTQGKENTIRIHPPAPGYPNGYWVETNGHGQPINPATGKPGSKPETHVPLPPNGA